MKHLAASVLFVFVLTVSCSSVGRKVAVSSSPVWSDTTLNQPSEVTLERIYSGCNGCPDKKVSLRRQGVDQFADAIVSETDLHTKKQRQGKLSAYYYNNLLRLIEGQGYFEMKDEYEMGWEDSLIVNISVMIGDKHKLIKTRNEGEVPINLWGIYMAVDGALSHVTWGEGKGLGISG
jgi:hypothetical protein